MVTLPVRSSALTTIPLVQDRIVLVAGKATLAPARAGPRELGIEGQRLVGFARRDRPLVGSSTTSSRAPRSA